jgi:hypothetical protein
MAQVDYPTLGQSTIQEVYSNMAAGVDTDTKRPYSLANMDSLALQKQTWDDACKVLSTYEDVFETGMSDVHVTYPNEAISLPESIGMRLVAGGASTQHTFPVLDPILGSLYAGTSTDLAGKEVGQRLRYVQAYYNEMKFGVMTETYGVNYNQVDEFGVYQKATMQLKKLFDESKGRAKRECLTQYFNRELNEDGSGVAGIGQHFNPNWFIANATEVSGKTDGNGVPTWSSTKQTFANNIAETLDQAATGTGGVDANISIPYLDYVSFLANEKLIDKTSEEYVIVIPTPQWYKLSALSGGMGDIWTSVNRYGEGKPTYPGEVGTYRDLRIVKDDRWAGLEVAVADAGGDTRGDATFTFEYVEPGGLQGDGRNKSVYSYTGGFTTPVGDRVWQIGWLLGKSAFLERVEKDLFFKEESQEYDKRKGIGGFMEAGWSLCVIRTDAATTGFPDYAENRSSAVLAFSGCKAY